MFYTIELARAHLRELYELADRANGRHRGATWRGILVNHMLTR